MKQGSILVTVLIIIAACTTLVLFIHEKTMTAFGSVITLQNDYQGAIYAMTAVEALEMAFQYDEAGWLIDQAKYHLMKNPRTVGEWHEGYTQAELFNLKKI